MPIEKASLLPFISFQSMQTYEAKTDAGEKVKDNSQNI